MNQLRTEGDRVYIEFCIQCEQHQWCTKHSSQKYLSYFNLCKTELLRFRSDLKVYSNEIPPKLSSKFHLCDNEKKVVPGKLAFPRIGAFEVYYRGVVVFSKLASGLWPRPESICENLRKIEEEEARRQQERERKRGKRSKSRRKKRRKKSAVMGSARTSPSRTMKSSQEPFVYNPSRRPMTSKTRTASAKRSRTPKLDKGYTNFSNERSQPYRNSLSSEESEKQYHDEGIQADRFVLGDQPFNERHEEVQKDFEDSWTKDAVEDWKFSDEFRAQEPVRPMERPKTAKKPMENLAQVERRTPSPPQVLQIRSRPTSPEEKKPTSPPFNPPLGTAEAISTPVVPEPAKTIAASAPPSNPPLNSLPARPSSSPPPAKPEPVIAAPRAEPEQKKTDAEVPRAKPQKPESSSSSSDDRKKPTQSRPQQVDSAREEEQYEEEDDQRYDSGEFDDEDEPPTHPLRPVTRNNNVEIPMGKYTNKKITYLNASGTDAVFTLVSSHPEEMHVKDSDVKIPAGEKGALRLQFKPVYEECEKRFYLYVDRDEEPWDCFEFIVKFT